MSVADHQSPVPAQPTSSRGTTATVALVVGAVGAAIGLFTPAFEFYVPAVFGVATIVLAIIGYSAQWRAWIAMALAAVALIEAAYGFVQFNKAEAALQSITSGPPAVASSGGGTGAQILNMQFGTTYTGTPLSIGLSKPVPYTPSNSAMAQQQTGRAVAFSITVTDKDAAQSFPTMALNMQATSGSTQDTAIEDSANNVGTSMATILPGKSLTWQLAYSIPKDAKDITVQVTSTGGGKTLVFSGTP